MDWIESDNTSVVKHTMSELPDLCNSSANELQNLRFQFPTSTHVLPTVSNIVDSHQWKQAQIGKQFVFIPYNIERFVRTGVLIEFNANRQVEQAILIEPVIDLNVLLNELQKQITTIYPDVVLRSSKDVQSNNLTNIMSVSDIDDRQNQNHLLNDLNESVEKINCIFIKETLDDKHIESLKDCVRKLENVARLHPHISKEMIDRIQESFLSKIESRFEEISRYIHSGIKNKISFSALEQLMKELDSIRTISSIIEQKTSQSYRNILGSIVEYLYESTKQIEVLLNELMQKQDNTVSYYQLRKSSLDLKQAQWIKNYRSSAYSYAMHNVERLVLEYIREIKGSIEKINFNRDSHDKIEFLQKRLAKLDEIKDFEILVPQISEYISEIDRCSNRLIANIQDSFSIETWRQHGCPIIDLNRAENAFYYLKNDQTDSLKEFIRMYSSYIQNEMRDCFDKIKQRSNMNTKDLTEKTRILSNRLQEIFEVKNQYHQVLACFINPKMFEHWQVELSDDIIDLEIELEILHMTEQIVLLNQRLAMIKPLSKLDRYLERDKYNDIYQKYKNIAFVQMKNILDRGLNAIQQDDYETVAYEIDKLPLSDNDIGEYLSIQFKRSLRIKLDDLMYKTRMQAIMLADSVQLEEIKSLVKSLGQIEKVKRFLSQYFDGHNELDICIDEAKKFIELRLSRFLESIRAVIMIHDFVEVEKRLDSITLVCGLLGGYCSSTILNEIKIQTERKDNVVLQEIVTKYSEMDIREYFFHPPIYIFGKFEAVVNVNSKYVEAFNKLKKIIFLKFTKELEQSRLDDKLRNEKISHLRRFESAVKYLPETIRNALEIELQHCKDDLL